MNFDTFLAENVVDGSDRFKAKRSGDFVAKLQGMAADMPNTFNHQADLERHVAAELDRIQVASDKALHTHILELGPIRHEYIAGTSVLNMLYYTSDPQDEHYPLAKAFVDKHGKEVQAAIDSELKAMKELAAWSAEQKWPTGANSLTRYTKYGSALHLLNFGIIPAIKRLMHK